MNKIRDLIIIGAGPASYTASIYASRYKLDHAIVGLMPGGAITSAHRVCNYPAFEDLSGNDLMMKMRQHALNYGVEELVYRVVSVGGNREEGFYIGTEGGKEFSSRALLIATGTRRRKLGISSESKFEGKGISHCATCDGSFYKDKVVAVVGGANAANMAAVYLSEIAKKVYVIYRRNELRGDRIWIDEVLNSGNIELILSANVIEFLGDETLRAVRLDRDNMELEVDGAFLEIGADPALDFDPGIKLTDEGYILVDESQKTSKEGIYAAGDITNASNGFQQVITACSEGAIAANSIYYWLKAS